MPNNRRRLMWISLLVLIAIVVTIVLTPVFLIMPFKAQTSRILEVSYTMRRWSPVVTVLASLVILTLTIKLWLGGRWWSRIILVLLLAPVFAATTKLTPPMPEPLAPLVIVTQATLLTAVHEQLVPLETESALVVPVVGTVKLVGVTV